jgi:hypothetical protein
MQSVAMHINILMSSAAFGIFFLEQMSFLQILCFHAILVFLWVPAALHFILIHLQSCLTVLATSDGEAP